MLSFNSVHRMAPNNLLSKCVLMLKEYEILIGLNYAVKLSVSFGGKIANLQVTV